MDSFGTRELRDLTGQHDIPCVSVYLPTHVAGEQGQQDPVRLKNLLQQAEERLGKEWMRSAEARELLKTARDLPNDSDFWGARSHGLALFLAPDTFQRYRLPLSFDEWVIVNRRFHIKPLLPLLTGGDRFFVLTLSQNKVRFYVATRYTIDRVEVNGLPSNMDDALNYVDVDRGTQVHSAMRGGSAMPGGGVGKQAAVFHGQGGQPETRKEDLTQFFQLIDSSLAPVLSDESTPLLLAGVEYLMPIYRDVSSYAHIAEPALTGNCDYLADHEIQQRAWQLMEPTFLRARDDAAAKYGMLAGTGKASDDIRQIVPAAHAGRVETLFVDTQALQWGRFDSETASAELHDEQETGDDDLLDLASVETLLCRGAVYAVRREQVPSAASVAAVFRY